MRFVKWSYGITTIPQRSNGLLPQTIRSLKAAGFDQPRLFVDGTDNPRGYERDFGLPVTCHYPAVKTFGNWVLTLWELYLREPTAHRYAIFQDDLIACKNLRVYLDKQKLGNEMYWNLYNVPENEVLVPTEVGGLRWNGFYPSNQKGKGAVALVFDRQGVWEILKSSRLVQKPSEAYQSWRQVDGAIIEALSPIGFMEYVHYPSLVQHTGLVSTTGSPTWPLPQSFPGEDWDAVQMLGTPCG